MPPRSIKSVESSAQSYLKATTSGSSNEKNVNLSPATVAEPLYQVKLLQALRNGDPAVIHPFLAEIGKDRRKSAEANSHGSTENSINTGAAALHLAVRCASVDTVGLLLSHRAISPNGIHPPGSGTTPLHLAASLGRVDIVNLLLEQEGINDTLRDAQGRTCRDVAKGKEVVKTIEDSHSFLNASYRSLLRSYVLSSSSTPPSQALVALLESPRIRFVDLSYLDDGSGHALLHEAARRKDLRLIELAVRAGADVFVRNRRGKMAGEGSGGKDDRVKVFLRQFANHDTTLIEAPTIVVESPLLRGYLNKYTNVAKGYNTRWFVLKNGILSYYRHQEDETVASRGSISMKTAALKLSSSDRLRFEVHAAHTHGHGSGSAQKWYMKANHPVEASRWTNALAKSIDWCRREDEGETSAKEGRRKSGESDSSAMRSVRSTQHRFSGTLLRRGGAKSAPGSADSITGSRYEVGDAVAGDASPDLAHGTWGKSGFNEPGGDLDDPGEDADADDVPGEAESSSGESGARVPPHEASFELQGNSATAQMELTAQLLSNLVSGSGMGREAELKDALTESFSMVQGLLHEYVDMAKAREAWWRRQLEQERKRQKFWEESLATVVKEGETLERELRVRSRRRGSKFFDGSMAEGTLKARPSVHNVPGGNEETVTEIKQGNLPEGQTSRPVKPTEPSPTRKTPNRTDTQETVSSVATTSTITSTPTRTPTATSLRTSTPNLRLPLASHHTSSKLSDPTEEDADTDEEDEFFDAIESGTLPNLIMPDVLASSGVANLTTPILPGTTDLAPYEGYRHLRLQLDLNEERPSTSLWSVLKHSIGKDLTKISFPVFFNEPTSMLQRMAEDMEFSECLDAAAKEKDPLRRLAFVAAFAMSNYSSTIGRIAKPFNPMLSETFEYVRFDKEYRYMSEQVSHHPPISACWAESPLWHYFGEVDAQNKFMGKSFEIRPTGIAHADLIIPAERGGPGYPKAPAKYGEGKVIEHYSWKKVTTNVSGFILGSPTIDHYGDMIVTNHRTGDQCILTFKPRGWRGKDAFEIAGQVVDASSRVVYQIAGRWNSQLIASPSSVSDALNPDLEVDGSSSSGHHLVLWRNSEKIAGSPFNLTPFAITLNDCPETTLLPYLCPTDCRLRPDQRAFEIGKWELANDLKAEQEQKQRAIRKAREEGRMPPHKPRWFTAETDGDTGERVWTPSRIDDDLEYWIERERIYKLGGAGKAQWKDVDEIFIEAPEGIK